jgi:predicted  nucleic acid-binding Zn-ribbon protein
MATLKRIEKRMNDVEEWVKDFEKGAGPAQTMDNMNWLLAQVRAAGDRLREVETQAGQMQQALQDNANIVNEFVEKNELVMQWQGHIAAIQKENEDALQKQETEGLDVQEQAEDGDGMGEGNA